MPFQKGRSGNPDGRPYGALNKNTIIAQSLLEGQAEALVGKVIQLALEGDPASLRLCLERLVPVKKDAPIRIEIPEIAAVADIPKLLAAIAAKLGEGGITPPQAAALIDLADGFRKSLQLVELETRISTLERNSKSKRA